MLLTANRNYRLLFSASAISNLGDGVSVLAYPWLASMISRDPLDIAFVAFASRLPWFLFTLPAGVITDRFPHRQIMFRADMFRFLITLGVVFAVFALPEPSLSASKSLLIPLLSLAAFLLGMAEVLRDNTAQTILPSLVASDDLPKANGQLWSVEQIMGQFIGPPLAGFLIAWALPLPFLLDAITFAVAATLIYRLSASPASKPKQSKPALGAMKEGFVWLVRRPMLLLMAVMTGLMNFGATISLTILVLFAQEILQLGAIGYGLLLTCGAAGGVIGGLVAPWVVTRIGEGWGLRAAVALIAVESTLIGIAAHPSLVGVALFAGVFGSMLWNVVAVPMRQRLVPPDLLGRVNSVYRFFSWGMMPVGALLAGVLVSVLEGYTSRELALRAPYFVVGVGFVALTVIAFRRFSNAGLNRLHG